MYRSAGPVGLPADSISAANTAKFPLLFTAPPTGTGLLPAQAPCNHHNSLSIGAAPATPPPEDRDTAVMAAEAVAGWLQNSSSALPAAALVAATDAVAEQHGRSSALQSGGSAAEAGPHAAFGEGTGTSSGRASRNTNRVVPKVTGWMTLQQQLSARLSQQQQVSEKQRAAERKLAEQQALLKQQLEALRQLRSRSPSPLRGSGIMAGSVVGTGVFGRPGSPPRSASPARSAAPVAAAAGGRAATPVRGRGGPIGSGSSSRNIAKTAVTVGDLLVSPSSSGRDLMTSPRGDMPGGSGSSSHTSAGIGSHAAPPRSTASPGSGWVSQQQAEGAAGSSTKQQLRSAAESLLRSLQDGTPMPPDALASLLSAVGNPSAAAAAAALAASSAAAQEVAEMQQATTVPASTGSSPAKKKPFVLVLPGCNDGSAAAGSEFQSPGAIGGSSSSSQPASSSFNIPKGLLSLSFRKKASKPPSQQRPKTYRAFCRHPALSPKSGAVVKYSSFRVAAHMMGPKPSGSPKFLLISPSTRFNSKRIMAGLNSTVQQQAAVDADPVIPGAHGAVDLGQLSQGLGVLAGAGGVRGASTSSAAWSLRSQQSFAVSGEFNADAVDEETAGTAALNPCAYDGNAGSRGMPSAGSPRSPAGYGGKGGSPGRLALAAAAATRPEPASPKQQKFTASLAAAAATAASGGKGVTGRRLNGAGNDPNSKTAPGPSMHTPGRRATTDVASASRLQQRAGGSAAGRVAHTAGARQAREQSDSAATIPSGRRATGGDVGRGHLHMMSRHSYLQVGEGHQLRYTQGRC